MARGGKRKGAGRPKGTGKFGEPTKAIRLPISMIDRIMQFIMLKGLVLPLYSTQTPVTDNAIAETLETFDLMERMALNSTAPIFVSVQDDFMKGAGISSGDILVSYPQDVPANGNIVLVIVDKQLTVKRVLRKGEKIELTTGNPAIPSIEISGEEAETNIWGVVKYVIHEV
ncbi:MAG: hypothetical protein LBT05_11160 [Planctomycetaceae bacterium]|nr:hypothetical protein [Planctomycetaceae bacterium]